MSLKFLFKKYIIAILILGIGAACAESTGVIFPKPTGLYSIGYQDFEFTDTNRIDPYNSPQLRKIKVTVYYPSNEAFQMDPNGYGKEGVAVFTRLCTWAATEQKITQTQLNEILDNIAHIRIFKKHAASIAENTFPVIIFEHGFECHPGQYQSIIQEWVSHGYVVVAPAHPYVANTVIFADGTMALFKANTDEKMFATVMDDAWFLFDQLSKLKLYVPCMDIDNIGIAGHSLGGMVTLRMGRLNPNVRAAIQLDAPVDVLKKFIDDTASDFSLPFMHIFAEESIGDHSKIHLGTNNFKVVVKNTKHCFFTDNLLLKEIKIFKELNCDFDTGTANFATYHPRMTQLFLTFWNKFLKNQSIDVFEQINTCAN